MGLFDKARQWLGIAADDDIPPQAQVEPGTAPPPDRRRDPRRDERRGGRERPPLRDMPPPQSASVEDALEARAAGDREGARKILRDIDRGGGLRTVLRAAAALEANDVEELEPLLAAVARETTWRLLLQIAGAMVEPEKAAPLLERASRAGAPAWALAWARASSEDPTVRREGLVELLFADAALARTVASRDLGLVGAEADGDAAQRYAAFAHGRDSIRRFGADTVARLLDRAGAA